MKDMITNFFINYHLLSFQPYNQTKGGISTPLSFFSFFYLKKKKKKKKKKQHNKKILVSYTCTEWVSNQLLRGKDVPIELQLIDPSPHF
jgi:hypothetical protein